MPFHLPFRFPYFPNAKYNSYSTNKEKTNIIGKVASQPHESKKLNLVATEKSSDFSYAMKKEKDSENIESSESFFEIFGIKLYFDDILIICILFFLYSEKVKDDELFICLLLLLFT